MKYLSKFTLLTSFILISFLGSKSNAAILIPMDEAQSDHLKAYGLAYWALEHPRNYKVEWLLNYRGGSFLIKENTLSHRKANQMGVTSKLISPGDVAAIHAKIEQENMEVVLLEKAPQIAVYSPPTQDPWDDAVDLALEYAEIPYTVVWDDEVLRGDLGEYDWLHLHHEDFSGQFGKFFRFRNAPWYKEKKRVEEETARKHGFDSVAENKRAVVLKMVQYISEGGFIFAMCNAAETFDISLAAENLDIVAGEYDGDGLTPGFQQKLNYNNCLAFKNFTLIPDALVYELSNIDTSVEKSNQTEFPDLYFTLFDFSAKMDPVPTMLVQNHTNKVKEFRGKTTAFRKDLLKDRVRVLGEFPNSGITKYIHGNYGKGTFTFYGGHDPEDYAHIIGEAQTELPLHKNSPGYRLILNNILFPAAKKKKLKT